MTLQTYSIDDFKARLEDFIAGKTGTTAVIDEMTPLAGGASRDSWAITVRIDGAPEQLVMRRDLPTTMNDSALTREQEFTLMRAAHNAGVKAAQVRWFCDDPDVLGLPFFLMDYVEGVSIGRKVIAEPSLQTARDAMPEQMADQLALIHKLDPDDAELSFLPRPDRSPAREAVTFGYEVLDGLGVKSAVFEFLLRWAEQHAPSDGDITVLHGDFRVGNLLVDAHGLAAVIDWEFAHIGDPHEEIGYMCMRDWRFGNDHLHMGGLCTRARFIDAYEDYSGRSINRHAADWWEIVGNIRWGIICLAQAQRHLSGHDPSVELASLGRRSAEMQLEALRLIEKVGV